jgi:hypothetical protein
LDTDDRTDERVAPPLMLKWTLAKRLANDRYMDSQAHLLYSWLLKVVLIS